MIVIEIIMLFAGIWALVTAKIPSWVLGGPRYKLEGGGARLLGLILVLPLPLAFVGGFVLALFLGEEGAAYATLLELLLVAGAAIAAVIVSRFVRQPATMDTTASEGSADIEAIIGKKAQGSLIYALLGILGFSAILVCPLAYVRAGQALRLMDAHHVGEQHRGTAKAARILAAIIFLFYAAVAVGIIALAFSGP